MNTSYLYTHLKQPTELSAKRKHVVAQSLNSKNYTDCFGLPFREQHINGVYVDGGGLNVNGEIIPNTSLTSGWQSSYDFKKTDAVHVKGTVIFIGFLCNYCWGHAITDSLAHIWWFHTQEYRDSYSNLPIYYWSPKPLSGNYLELMRMAGLPVEKLIHLEELSHFENAIVPDNCFDRATDGIRKYSIKYIDLIDSVISQSFLLKANVKTYDKIVLLRSNQSRQYFAKDIIKVLKHKGYNFIDPLQFSLSDQIVIYHSAKVIVTEESSMAHNAIFCKEGTKLYILRKCNCVNEYQTAINQMRNLDITYIDCHLSVLANPILPTEGPFFCYANELFCNCFDVEYMGFPYKEFHKWLKYHNWFLEDVQTRADRLVWDKNYTQIFAEELTKSRIKAEKRLTWIKHLPLIPNNIRERGFVWAVKKCVRGLM